MSFFKKLTREIEIEQEEEKDKEKNRKEEKTDKRKKEKKIKPTRKDEEKAEEKEEEEFKKSKFTLKEIPVTKNKKNIKNWVKPEGRLAVDVYLTESEFCVQAPIAGIGSNELDVSIENEMLLINGERKEPDKDKEKNYFHQECYWGLFTRKIILPEDVDASRTVASLNKGILSIRIPRVKKAKKKKITVKEEQ